MEIVSSIADRISLGKDKKNQNLRKICQRGYGFLDTHIFPREKGRGR